MIWTKIDPTIPAHRIPDLLGFIPMFLDENDPRSAREQFQHSYAHGGGWEPFEGFRYNSETKTITYPGDMPLKAIASTRLREETILVFPHAWVLVEQLNGAYEISRMD